MIHDLAEFLGLGSLLEELRRSYGGYEIVAHWAQGEFHHDLVLRVNSPELPGPYVVVATNCNGGVKEILVFADRPDRSALWRSRSPDNADFHGDMPAPLASVRTIHWFDPRELLTPDARSEYKDEHRERQLGGGWQVKSSTACVVGAGEGPEVAVGGPVRQG
jgi:hypothetical protein